MTKRLKARQELRITIWVGKFVETIIKQFVNEEFLKIKKNTKIKGKYYTRSNL